MSQYPPDGDGVYYAAKVVELLPGGCKVVYTDPEFEGEPPEPVKFHHVKAKPGGAKPQRGAAGNTAAAPPAATAGAGNVSSADGGQAGAGGASTSQPVAITLSTSSAQVLPDAAAIAQLSKALPFWDSEHTWNVSDDEAGPGDLVSASLRVLYVCMCVQRNHVLFPGLEMHCYCWSFDI